MIEAVLIDTEVNSFAHMEPVELAWSEYRIGRKQTGILQEIRFCPEHPIDCGAAAVHGILPCDLDGCIPSSRYSDFLPEASYWIGHKIDFDWEVLGKPDVKRICTEAICRSLFEGFESYKLTAIYYELFGLTAESRSVVKGAHGAMADVVILSGVVDKIVERSGVNTIEELHSLSEESRIPKIMPFGKHKGEQIADIPTDYRRWLLKQTDVDPYLVKSLQEAESKCVVSQRRPKQTATASNRLF